MISFEQLKAKIEAGEVEWDCPHDTQMKTASTRYKDYFYREIEMRMFRDYDESEGFPIFWDTCSMCGEFIYYTYNDNKFIAKTKQCFEQTPYSVELEFPTGTLILADRLEYAGELLTHLEEKCGRLHSEKAIRLRSEVYAEHNVVHFFVGNTCPRVNQLPNGFSVGRIGLGEEDEEIPFDEGVEAGYICTDLWWVTAVDFQDYERLAIEKFGEEEGKRVAAEAKECAHVVLQVEPGRYRCDYYWLKEENPELLLKVVRI